MKKLAVFALLLLATGACERASYSVTVAEDSYLESREGRFPFKLVDEETAKWVLNHRDAGRKRPLLAETPKLKVIFSFHRREQNLMIASEDSGGEVVLPLGKSMYRVGGAVSESTLRWQERGSVIRRPMSSPLRMDRRAKTQLKAAVISFPIDKLAYFDGEGRPVLHEIRLPFSVGDEEYVAHLNLKMERRSYRRLSFRVPATP